MVMIASSGAVLATTDTVDTADVVYKDGMAFQKSTGALYVTISGSISGSVKPRSGLLLTLLATGGLVGEQSYATDYPFTVYHNGVAGEAVAEYRRMFGTQTTLDAVVITQNTDDLLDLASRPYSPTFKISGTLGGNDQDLSLPLSTSAYGRTVRGGLLCVVNNNTSHVITKTGDAMPDATIAAGKGQAFMFSFGLADVGWIAIGSNFTPS